MSTAWQIAVKVDTEEGGNPSSSTLELSEQSSLFDIEIIQEFKHTLRVASMTSLKASEVIAIARSLIDRVSGFTGLSREHLAHAQPILAELESEAKELEAENE